ELELVLTAESVGGSRVHELLQLAPHRLAVTKQRLNVRLGNSGRLGYRRFALQPLRVALLDEKNMIDQPPDSREIAVALEPSAHRVGRLSFNPALPFRALAAGVGEQFVNAQRQTHDSNIAPEAAE